MKTASALIHKRLQREKALAFVEFMQIALYHSQGGYYSGSLTKFGPKGDFITAPELTPLFGQTLAYQCQPILADLKNPSLFEFGAGSGRLCVDILRRLEQLDSLPGSYFILEVSNNLYHRQSALIQQEIPHLANRIHWLQSWPKEPFSGVVIANEVLDAMPVHRFLQTQEGLFESFATLNTKNEIEEIFRPCENLRLQNHVKQILTQGNVPYLSEANLFIEDWITECSNMLQQGMMLIIDYGFPRAEYYHPDRRTGTLMCHYQHQAHTNPFIHIAEQDISAHVDFTHVAEAAVSAGFRVAGYTNQASFLLGNGLLNLLESLSENADKIKTQQAVKQLIQPNEMGELFKVMALTKNIDFPLAGFQLYDKRVSL